MLYFVRWLVGKLDEVVGVSVDFFSTAVFLFLFREVALYSYSRAGFVGKHTCNEGLFFELVAAKAD